jgi:hypothetical protein
VEKVTGSWRRLHNEELHNVYSSPNHGCCVRWSGNAARMGGNIT